MTANVSSYLIYILALRVKGHSLQERNVLGKKKKKKYIYIYIYVYAYALGHLERLITQYRTKTKLEFDLLS